MRGAAPTPCKKLIRILAQYCIVIIVPEAWTSQTCPSCRRRTEVGGYRTRKCTTPPDAEPSCRIPVNADGERVVDRDIVGGINIGLRGMYHLLRRPLSLKPLGM
jgi:transposase